MKETHPPQEIIISGDLRMGDAETEHIDVKPIWTKGPAPPYPRVCVFWFGFWIGGICGVVGAVGLWVWWVI